MCGIFCTHFVTLQLHKSYSTSLEKSVQRHSGERVEILKTQQSNSNFALTVSLCSLKKELARRFGLKGSLEKKMSEKLHESSLSLTVLSQARFTK